LDEQTSWIVDETRRTVDSLQRNSKFFHQNPPKSLPVFEEKELHLGQVIGNGQFGMVFEVTGFCLIQNKNIVHSQQKKSAISYAQEIAKVTADDFPMSLDNDGMRTYMSDNALRDGSPRFAVKRVRLDLVDERKGSSAIDLAVEAKFLASIDHSNIIKLRGTVSSPGFNSFMIVLDRLYSILNKTIEQWRQDVRATRGIFGWKVVRKVDHYKAKTERLICLYDIARALKHLHNLRILYRDLKPENIGCDVRGDYKIFDMGLSKELKQDLLRVAPDGYECTGLTGSRRWMAPEVCLCKLYGLSSDVYSFCLLFYHVMTLELPYSKYDLNKHMSHVVIGGERPNGNRIKASPTLRDTVMLGWNANPHKRPSMSAICDAIRKEVVDRKQDVKKNRRRSTVAGILRRSQLLQERSELSMVGEDEAENRPD
jgi:serine/threonine protein kinase